MNMLLSLFYYVFLKNAAADQVIWSPPKPDYFVQSVFHLTW